MVACLVNLFKLDFIWISLVHWSHWGGLLGVGPGFVLWGFLVAFFLFLGAKLEFSWFRRLLSVVLGGCVWGYGIGSGPFFMGGH